MTASLFKKTIYCIKEDPPSAVDLPKLKIQGSHTQYFLSLWLWCLLFLFPLLLANIIAVGYNCKKNLYIKMQMMIKKIGTIEQSLLCGNDQRTKHKLAHFCLSKRAKFITFSNYLSHKCLWIVNMVIWSRKKHTLVHEVESNGWRIAATPMPPVRNLAWWGFILECMLNNA